MDEIHLIHFSHKIHDSCGPTVYSMYCRYGTLFLRHILVRKQNAGFKHASPNVRSLRYLVLYTVFAYHIIESVQLDCISVYIYRYDTVLWMSNVLGVKHAWRQLLLEEQCLSHLY